jgi:tRNA-specific 2-thiouridylase
MKVLLGMSGGVDSAYAACELVSRGYEVEGAILVMHPYAELDDARRTAREIGIPLHEIDCTEPFERIVKSYFVDEYLNARTPNPCIVCNEKVKLEYLWRYARERGFDCIATGHYARIDSFNVDGTDRFAIGQGTDAAKDQSYMLYRLPQYILRDLLLPLADMEKSNVRAAARTVGIS